MHEILQAIRDERERAASLAAAWCHKPAMMEIIFGDSRRRVEQLADQAFALRDALDAEAFVPAWRLTLHVRTRRADAAYLARRDAVLVADLWTPLLALLASVHVVWARAAQAEAHEAWTATLWPLFASIGAAFRARQLARRGIKCSAIIGADCAGGRHREIFCENTATHVSATSVDALCEDCAAQWAQEGYPVLEIPDLPVAIAS